MRILWLFGEHDILLSDDQRYLPRHHSLSLLPLLLLLQRLRGPYRLILGMRQGPLLLQSLHQRFTHASLDYRHGFYVCGVYTDFGAEIDSHWVPVNSVDAVDPAWVCKAIAKSEDCTQAYFTAAIEERVTAFHGRVNADSWYDSHPGGYLVAPH